jgi:DNA-binding SARP family transcriptional activator
MAVRLVTFGGLQVAGDSGELDRLLSQRSRAALFIYLMVERRVLREKLTAMFWPESAAEDARHALRQSLYHLRNALGGSDWVNAARVHELVVSSESIADTATFTEAVELGDIERAVRLYRGQFLDGVHLVDLQPWESWVDGRRTRYARAFRKACRELVNAKLSAGDVDGAVAAAERWTAPDPTDDEAQHQLIATLAAAGERMDAIRQYDTYVRLLAPEGLEPLEETRALVERLRSSRIARASWRASYSRVGSRA